MFPFNLEPNEPDWHCQDTVLIYIRVNAAGRGDRWCNATGWSCYTFTRVTVFPTSCQPASAMPLSRICRGIVSGPTYPTVIRTSRLRITFSSMALYGCTHGKRRIYRFGGFTKVLGVQGRGEGHCSAACGGQSANI